LKRAWAAALALIIGAAAVAAVGQSAASPILILISFDGFRWDYIERGESPHLQALAARGVRSKGLIPSFPSFTYPNHYTIVTGLYPSHHGIVANNIADPEWPERFSMSSRTSRDARWWGGEPIWVTAMRRGMRAASVFWPGSETPVGGAWLNEWVAFDDEMPNVDRVNHVLDWLAWPAADRPSMLSLYFSETDHVGHDYGPDTPEILEAIRHEDAALGLLESGLRQLNLLDRTTLVAVSDHGMAPLSDRRVIFLDDYIDLSRVDVIEWGELLQMKPRTGSAAEIHEALRGKHPALTMFLKDHAPARFHYSGSDRIAPILGLASEGWEVTSHARWANDLERRRKRGGTHGYDPRLQSMHGLFVAAGPRVRQGFVAPEFENIHIYNFLCGVLGLTPANNDGDPSVTRAFLTR
jgi:predicted AlkP superfamily pyrophosphatase or phosphodiesterase